jgi:anti-sigma B factor antagonist
VSDANDFVVRVCAADDGVALVVHIIGELDVATSGDLAEHVEMAVGTGAVRHVVLDLTDVSFMDARGISALVRCHRAVEAVSGDLEVIGAHGEPLRLLRLTDMFDYLTHESHPTQKPHLRSTSRLASYVTRGLRSMGHHQSSTTISPA